jgi:hypothetical protein
MKLNLVPARSGALWVKRGVATFFKQPPGMAGLFFMFMALMTIASMVPVLGLPLAMTVLPSATLALMMATQDVTQGKFPMPLVLLAGLRAQPQKARALVLLGVIYATGFMAAMGVAYLVDGGGFARMYLGGQAPSKEVLESSGFMAAMWTFIGLHLPLSLLLWHAPALVYWQDVPAVKSLFFSAVACFRNFWAFTLFAACWMGVMVAVVLAVITLSGLLNNTDLLGVVLFPALMLVAAMFFTSLYFSYRDCFQDEPDLEKIDPTI